MQTILTNTLKKLFVELVPSNIGSVPKNTKIIKNSTVRNKIALPTATDNTNNANLPITTESNKTKNMIVKFVPKTNNNKITTAKQNPSLVTSQESETKQTESNTVSNLSTQQSNATTNVGAGTSSTAVFPGSLAHHKNPESWPSLQERAFLEREATVGQIERYIKNNLFHKLKFVSCPTMMLFSRDSHSLCQVACTYFNVPKNYHHQFWAHFGKYFNKFLNKKRADVSNSMQNSFKGM